MQICPECKKSGPDNNEFCPKCGCRYDAYEYDGDDATIRKVKKDTYKMVRTQYKGRRTRALLIVAIAIMLVAAMVGIVGGNFNACEIHVEVYDNTGQESTVSLYINNQYKGDVPVNVPVSIVYNWALWDSGVVKITAKYHVSGEEESKTIQLHNHETAKVKLILG